MLNSFRLRRPLGLSLGLVLTLSNLLCASTAGAQPRRHSSADSRAAAKSTVQSPEKRARLVVGIVIDQFRYDYLARFEDLFVEGGFKRLLNRGALFANANYIHTPTYTACGHATFMSGAPPSLSGIVGNDWFDRELGQRVTSVSDRSVKLLGGREGENGSSPHRLLGTTIGDELKLASIGQAKVISLSLKDRASILPAGKRPNGAYWFDSNTGNLVSSTYYFNALPDWVKHFNREHRPDRFFGKRWERLLPEAAYQRSAPDDAAYEKAREGNKFPYLINGGEEAPGQRFYYQFEATPFASEYLLDFAKAAIENEHLGEDEVTDLLTISFSSNDLIGHSYGPYSQEVQDVTLRTDRVLADLFDYLDRKIGLDRVLIALTADHGVAPVPEQVRELGYGGRLEAKSLSEAVETALAQRFEADKWILSQVNGNIYFDESVVERRKAPIEEVERVACQALLKMPGIRECLTRTQLTSGRIPETPIAQSVAKGFYPPRNGNLVIVTQPFYIVSEGLGTTHGTPYRYDTHVPLILAGPRVIHGTYFEAASPADIAPTLAALLKIEAPSNSSGRILGEAIKTGR
ncbi:MAG TPA: alkaline phosphatase family protein [Blastocatellia bacterium]|nr:alkaline phosphatase family protein [Blastocatellia bacterium]